MSNATPEEPSTVEGEAVDGAERQHPPSIPPPRDAAERTLAMLRAELQAEDDPNRKAMLHFEVGRVLERGFRSDAKAVREYLAAYNLWPEFRPPLDALINIFERRRSFQNLAKLYDAEAKAATSDRERAAAILSRAELSADQLDAPDDADRLIDEALTADPGSRAAALMREDRSRRQGDAAGVAEALEGRIANAGDPGLRALLLTELALDREAAGDIAGALEGFKRAVAEPAARSRTLEHMERIARKHAAAAELTQSLEGRGRLALAAASGEEQGQRSAVVSTRVLTDAESSRHLASSLFYEGARLRMHELGDPEGAIESLDQAIDVRPNDLLLHQERMLAYELAADHDGAAREARYLIDSGVGKRFAASLHFRLAETAQANQDFDQASTELSAALAADPGSAATAAMLEDLLIDRGDAVGQVESLEKHAETAEGEAQSRLLWQAAHIASSELGDFDRASVLFRAAVATSDHPTPIRREFYGAALNHGRLDEARIALDALLEADIDEPERATLLREKYEILRYAFDDTAGADAHLRACLDEPVAASWALETARLSAASHGDWALLQKAHRALADRAQGELAAAHLSAAARAALRADDDDGAVALLRSALEHSPGHGYAVALLEELLQARGEAKEVVALLREAADSQAGHEEAVLRLLLAGAAAEASGDHALAANTYREAADHDPMSTAPLWALYRLGRKTNNRELLLSARQALSDRELADGEPARASLELAEQYDLHQKKAKLAEAAFRSTLIADQAGAAAAVGLLLLAGRDNEGGVRREALERLVADAREADVATFERSLGVAAFAAADDIERGLQASAKVSELREDDRWAPFGRLLHGLGDVRASGWVGLARATEDIAASAELGLIGLRATLLADSEESGDDAFLVAQDIAADAPESAAAGIALDETLTAADDPESRIEALESRISHSGRAGSASLTAALGRALTASGRGSEALERLLPLVEADPADLASWDAIRVAAREERRWELVVRACDALAAALAEIDGGGELEAELLEEAAAVLMDELGEDAEAELRLQRALRESVDRRIAYGRLHDLLAEREDTAALGALVQRKLEAIDDPEELEKLFYEQARLMRSDGDLDGALGALENLLMLEENHVGGLALQVEIQVALERWEDAVDSLRALANADVPASQRRLARLGASDFLHKKLGDADGAIAELRAVVDLGLGDAALFVRMADVAEDAGLNVDAARALEDAAIQATGEERATHLYRAGRLAEAKLLDPGRAKDYYRQGLEAQPTHLGSAEALANLLTEPLEREQLSVRFEEAVRRSLESAPTDAELIRMLQRAAEWRGDRVLVHATLGALSALGLALPDEEQRYRATVLPPIGGSLSEESFAALMGPPNEAVSASAIVAQDTLLELVRLEPSGFGVGRGQLQSPKKPNSVRDELQTIARAFGVTVIDCYIGGSDPGGVALVAGKKGPAWVVGQQVSSPLSPSRRFVAGQLAAAYRIGALPVTSRTADRAATLLFAALAASDRPVHPGPRPDLEDLTKAAQKKLPRKTRKTLTETGKAIQGAEVEPWCYHAQAAALRAGTLVAGDLRLALGAVLGGGVSGEAVLASEPARQLLSFWLSSQIVRLRHEIGLVP
ncbi:MAG: hypothetical protein AAGF12_00680 [Myxococcota bacterium]